MKISKILVHLNLSEISDALLLKLKRLAQQKNVTLELFVCCYNSALHRSYLFDEEAEKHAIAGYLHQEEEKLIRLAESFGELGSNVSYDITWNRNIAEEVIRKALRYSADIVISVIDKHPQGHYLFRQGDWKLIADCPVSLLLMRDKSWSVHPRVGALVDPFHQNDTPHKLDHEILDNSRSFVQLILGELHVVHCFHSIPQSAIFDEHLTIDYAALHEKVKEQHTRQLKSLVDAEELKTAILHLEDGELHSVVPKMVEREHIDLIVMGSIARGVIDRLLIGSSVERIVDHVSCDILLVKQPGFISPVTE